MHTIQISVRDKIATQTDGTVIINGNSDYNIEFDFDTEWADLNNKIGIFAYNDAAAHKWAYQTVMFSGNTCAVPILRDIHCVYIGVKAGNVRVTTPAKVQCRLSISDYADTEEPPSADIWGQILAKFDELQTEIDEIKAGGVGGGAEVYYAELDGEYPSYTLSAETPLADIAKAYAASKSIVCRCKISNATATLPLFIPMPEMNTWYFSGSGALAQIFTVAITPFGVEAEQIRIAAQTDLDAVAATANEAVLYTPQNLVNAQKQQARKNIGATDISLGVTATVGQTIKVKAVDADGKPTAWEAVDMAAGDTEVWEKVCQVTTTENVSFIYQPFGGYYKKIRAIFRGETTVAGQVWIYPNTETQPGGRDVAYIFNAPHANTGKYTIIGEFSSSPYPAPNSADNWYRGRCSISREWRPEGLHAGWGDSLFDNYVANAYAKDIAQGVKSLYWTHSGGEIKAGAQMVVYGVKA